jgi:hypothetical protein
MTIIPPDGIVNLKDKQYPICELHLLHQHHHINQHKDADYNNNDSDNDHNNNNHVFDYKCNELKHDYDYDPHYVYTRGHVDVTNFKKYLQSLPNSIWNDDNQDGKLSYLKFIYSF